MSLQQTLPCAMVLVLVALVSACGDSSGSDGVDPLDLPDLEEGWVRWVTPVLDLPAGGEAFWCTFATFEEDAAILDAIHATDSPLLHLDHILTRAAPDDIGYADGETIDCTTLGSWWYHGTPLYESVRPVGGAENAPGLNLPDGLGFPAGGGQRFVIDGHFINPSSEDQTAVVTVDMLLAPPESVNAMAGAISLDMGAELHVPPGDTTTLAFDCAWQEEVNILQVGPHMHEHGEVFRLEWLPVDGSPETLIDIDDWQGTLGGYVEGLDFAPNSVTVSPGDVFRTECTWANPTDYALGFPEEMCTTIGVGYPLPDGAVCVAGDGEIHPPDE